MLTFEDVQREIGAQDRARWEEVWNALLHAEAPAFGVRIEDIDWDFRVSLRDQGRDITVKRGTTGKKSVLLPEQPSIWSIKSGANGKEPATLAEEINHKTHTVIRQVLTDGGKYFYCVCFPASSDERTALAAKATELEQSLGVAPGAIVILHDNHLVEHLKRLPGVLRTYCPHLGAKLGQSLEQWGQGSGLLFDPSITFVDFPERAVTLREIVEHLHWRSNNPLLHLAGASGIGKSRIVYEACQRAGLKDSVLYYPDFVAAAGVLDHMRHNASCRATLVIDECTLDEATKLNGAIAPLVDRVRVVSIGPARVNDRSREYIRVLSPPASASVAQLLRSQAGEMIEQSVLNAVGRESSHDLRFALQLLRVVQDDPALAANAQDAIEQIANPKFVFNRVLEQFKGTIGSSGDFLKLYRWLTLSRETGCREHLRGELEYLATVSGSTIAAMDDIVDQAKQCGLGEAPAHLFEAIPRGMATLIFCNDLWPAIDARFQTIFAGAPSDSFRQSIMSRVEMCPQALRREVVSRIDAHFREDLGDPTLAAIGAAKTSRAVRAWIELSPLTGLGWLATAVEQASIPELRGFKGVGGDYSEPLHPRREVVWAVSNLACFSDYYDTCERILFRLALAENEDIGNSASGKWKERHRVILSNAESPYPHRVDILIGRFAAAAADSVPLLLTGLTEAITWPHSAMSPPPVIGGRLVPEEWRPKRSEVYPLMVRTISLGLQAMSAWDPPLRKLGRDCCIDNFSEFAKEDTLAELRTFLDESDASQKERLRAVVEEETALHLRSGEAKRAVLIAALQAWKVALAPTDDVEFIKAVVSRQPWEYDRLNEKPEPDDLDEAVKASDRAWESHYRDAASRVASTPTLLVELEGWLNEQEGDSQYSLGDMLFHQANVAAVTETLMHWLRVGTCLGVCGGFCDRYRESVGDLPSWAVTVLDEEVARQPEYVARATSFLDPTVRGFTRILRCADQAGTNPSKLFARLFGIRWDSVLTPQRQAVVLDQFLTLPSMDQDQQRTFVHLLRMYLHGRKGQPLPNPLLPAVRSLLSNPPASGGSHAGYEWKEAALKLRSSDPAFVRDAAIGLLSAQRTNRGFGFQEALGILKLLSQERAVPVLPALATSIQLHRSMDHMALEEWQALFATFEVAELQAVTAARGKDFARAIGQFIPDMTVTEEGLPSIPAVTEWYLSQFGSDQDCFDQYSLGRWNGRLTTGWAFERLPEVERKMKAFERHPLPAVRRWAAETLDSQRRDAARDRVAYEDERKRG